MKRIAVLLILAGMALLLPACGGGGGDGSGLQVKISGLPDGAPAKVTVTGPGNFSRALTVSKTLSGLAPGQYTVTAAWVISGEKVYVATVTGSPATVRADQMADVSVSYKLVASDTGSLFVSIGGVPSGTTPKVAVSGPYGYGCTVSKSTVLSDLVPGSYTVAGSSLTWKGDSFAPVIQGSPAEVVAGSTVTVTVNYPTSPTTGSLSVVIRGLPGGVNADVAVAGPNGYHRALTETATLSGLTPGSYTVTADEVSGDGTTYTATVTGSPASVTAGKTAQSSVTYSSSGSGEGNVALITVTPASAGVAVGGTQQFTAVAKDASGNALSGITFIWASSDTVVATVEGSGLATGVAAGTAQIIASAGGVTSNVATLTVTGGGGGGSPPVIHGFTADPASISAGQSSTLSWDVAGATSLSIDHGVGDVGGRNSVLVQPDTTTTYTLTATNGAGSSTAQTTVTVTAQVAISISPRTATLALGGTQQFTATVTGSSNTAVTWSVQERNGGGVTSSGLYTAPNAVGTYHVVATSQADSSKQAVATVTVANPTTSYTLSLSGSHGQVEVNGTAHGLPYSRDFSTGSTVTLEAVPDSGYSFSGWSGDLSGSDNPTSVTMDGDKSITVNFSPQVAPGSLAVTPATGFSASGPRGGPFSPNSQRYTLANSGGAPIGWTASKGQDWVSLSQSGGTLAPGDSATVTVSLNDNAAALSGGSHADTVNFTNTTNGVGNTSRAVSLTVSIPPPETYTLSVTKSGHGSGTVTSDPDGIDCGDTCSAAFNEGTSVTLTATPEEDATFAGWGGACGDRGRGRDRRGCRLTVNGDMSVTATFDDDDDDDDDHEHPTVEIQSPEDGTTVTDASLTVTGTAEDNVGVTAVVYALNDGSRQECTGSSSFTCQVNHLPSGDDSITVYADDGAGNEGSGTVHITVTGDSVPAINSFAANPTTINAGDSSTLSWDVTGATSLSIDNSVGDVTDQSSARVTPTATTTYTLTATDSAGSVTAQATVTVNAPPPPPPPPLAEPFNITLNFVSSVSDSQRQAFEDAAARWGEVITQGVPDVSVFIPAGRCGNGFPASDVDETVDDLLIDVAVVPIDGVNNILGQGGPCWIRGSDSLTIYGYMQFDSADLDNLEQNEQLQDTILHEMGHVLGIGTLWNVNRALLMGAGTDNPRFIGTNAVREWQALTGTGYVPVENCLDIGGSPIPGCGDGARDSHWREAVFGDELMTEYIGSSNPLSRMTIGSLQDLGYQVNYGAADAYSLPPALSVQSEQQAVPLHFILTGPQGSTP